MDGRRLTIYPTIKERKYSGLFPSLDENDEGEGTDGNEGSCLFQALPATFSVAAVTLEVAVIFSRLMMRDTELSLSVLSLRRCFS